MKTLFVQGLVMSCGKLFHRNMVLAKCCLLEKARGFSFS